MARPRGSAQVSQAMINRQFKYSWFKVGRDVSPWNGTHRGMTGKIIGVMGRRATVQFSLIDICGLDRTSIRPIT